MITKRIICPDRIRSIPKHFSWIDHMLVRKKYICGLGHESLALYLFLVTVSDVDGLSYYSDSSIYRYLRLERAALELARAELCEKGLLAYSNPFYQVLSLHSSSAVLPAAPCEKHTGYKPVRQVSRDAVHIGELIETFLGAEQ